MNFTAETGFFLGEKKREESSKEQFTAPLVNLSAIHIYFLQLSLHNTITIDHFYVVDSS